MFRENISVPSSVTQQSKRKSSIPRRSFSWAAWLLNMVPIGYPETSVTSNLRCTTSLKPFGTGVLHLIHINHQPDATVFQFIILTFVYSSTCFGHFHAHHQELNDCSGSLWFYLRIVVTVVLCSWSGRPARPQTQHDCHNDTKVKPEAATAFIELLMMGGKMPETCWAVNKLQDNKLKNYCIRLVIYLNCTMMHALTNLKFYI